MKNYCQIYYPLGRDGSKSIVFRPLKAKPWFRIWSDVHICLFTRIWESPRHSGDASSPSQTVTIFVFPRRINIQECERCELSRERWPWPCPCSLVISLARASHQCCDLPCVWCERGPVSSLLSRIFSFTAQIWHSWLASTTTTTSPTTSAALAWEMWAVTQNVTGHDIMSHISTLILMLVMSRSIACVSWHHPEPVTMCGDQGWGDPLPGRERRSLSRRMVPPLIFPMS